MDPTGDQPADARQLAALNVLVDPGDGAVSAEVIVAGAETGRGRLIVLRLGWWPADPLTVELLVTARPDHPALPRGRWVVLRDFLRYGLETPTGDGDVRIRPDRGAADATPDGCPARVWLELARAGRPCCVAVPVDLLDAFLDRTEEAVPVGEERSEELVDAFIARLLSA